MIFHSDMPRKFLTVCALAGITLTAAAQRIGLKTNALYWAAASPNVGVELRLNRHVTLNLEGAFNYFDFSSVASHAIAFTPEARYWLSARPLAGHFVGLMGLAASYKTDWKDTRHQGEAGGIGATYGYAFVLSSRWSIEATAGVGALRVREKRFDTTGPAPDRPNNRKWIAAPLKAGITITYILR